MRELKIETISKAASAEITREGYTLDESGVTDWLISKNIISLNERIINYRDIAPWERTGGETYSAIFEFTSTNATKQIVTKAIVTMFPEKSLFDWARRRKMLMDNGVPVSNWYSTSGATIYEDFYPFTAKEKVKFEALLSIGHKLDSLGFTTLKFIDDIRADKGGNPHLIDFGFDLGEPSENHTFSAKEYLMKVFPDKILEINNFYDKRIK